MATIRIVVNGETVMADAKYNTLRPVLADVATTKNVETKTVQSAVQKIGNPAAVAESLLAFFAESDTVEVYETPETKGAVEKLSARYSMKNLCKRLIIAGTADEFNGEIFTGETGEKQVKETVPQAFTFEG